MTARGVWARLAGVSILVGCGALLWNDHRQRAAFHAASEDQLSLQRARGAAIEQLALAVAGASAAPSSEGPAEGSLDRSLADLVARLQRSVPNATQEELALLSTRADELAALLAPVPGRMPGVTAQVADLPTAVQSFVRETHALSERAAADLDSAAQRSRLSGLMLAAAALCCVALGAMAERRSRRRHHALVATVAEAKIALCESEARLHKASQLAGLGYWEWDLLEDAHVWSDGVYALFGCDRRLPPIGYPEVRPYFDADSWQRFAAGVEQARRCGSAYACDLRIIRPDGRELWILAHGEGLRGPDGTVYQLRAILQNITQRKLAELALAEQESRYRGIVETTSDGFWAVDPAGRILSVNQAYVQRSGYNADELTGLSVADLESSETPPEIDRRLTEIQQLGSGLFETWHRTKHGEVWPAEVSVSYRDVGGGRYYAFIRDISDRKAAERAERSRQERAAEEQRRTQLAALNLIEDAMAARQLAEATSVSLRESEQRLLMAQEAAQVGIWEWDPSTNHVYWSPECYRLYGLRQGTPVTRKNWLSRVHPADLRQLESDLGGYLRSKSNFEVVLRARPVSGGVRWLENRGVARRDARGKLLGFIGVSIDITPQKRLLQELTRYRLHLEELVATRTAELTRAREDAERLAHAKSEFLANMSHEIRTPLSAVLGLARMGARDSVGRAALSHFVGILDAGEHLLGVINDILDYSKIEAGRLAIEQRPFLLADAIEGVRAMMASVAQKREIRLGTRVEPDVPRWVVGDPQRLQQVLVNLLSNAIKFTERGRVDLEVELLGDEMAFRVRDTGIGMTPEQLGRLFTPFEQADASTTRRFGGTGLGLAISLNLARLMGGDIEAESEQGVGSRFTLRLALPATAPPEGLTERAGSGVGKRLNGIRLLAAEDVEVNRYILEDLLAHEAAKVSLVENGREAMDALLAIGRANIDVVLMDIQMPEMDGFEATRRLRALAPDLPVIGLTAHALAEERERGLAAGMVDYVAKPIDAEVLIAAILRHCRPESEGSAARVPGPREDRSLAQNADARQRASPLVDWPALQERYQGRVDFIAKLLTTARQSNALVPDRLRAAADIGDLDSLAFIAHKLKGMAGNLEAPSLRSLASETELAARTGEAQALALGGRLAAELERLLAELGRHG